jgi:SAM-dependent methyltransferase
MIPFPADDSAFRFFDEAAEVYFGKYTEESPGGFALRVRQQKVLKMFDQPGGKVLDVGCGPGIMAEAILSRGCEFWGVDQSRKMIEMCMDRFSGTGRTHFSLGDALGLHFGDAFFDAVLCMGVIDGLRDRRLALREMMRVLKPGGTLIVSFANLCSPYAAWKKYVFYPLVFRWQEFRGRKRRAKPRPAFDPRQRGLFTERAARELMTDEGAQVLQTVGYYYNVFLSPLDEIWPSGALWLTKKLEEGHWPRPEWIGAGWILKSRKN